MMKAKKGYSMVVLVIAITVILLLASSTVSILQVSREKTRMTNFIFDLNAVEEEVQDFYTRTGTLPTKNAATVDMVNLDATSSNGILSQLSPYDNENYYYIDLSQLGAVSLKDSSRNYIVNEGSLKVYVTEGQEYSSFDDEDTKITYYTLTSTLVNGLEQYTSQEEEIIVTGNPVTWASEADLRVVIPRKSLEQSGSDSWENWIFRWDFGPKTEVELAAIPDTDSARNFQYGDTLKVKNNGIYSIYVESPERDVTVINVNVTKIDDIAPDYRFITNLGETQIEVSDNETGIKYVRYKTLQNYKDNVASAEVTETDLLDTRTEIDYYLVGGTGKDLIYNLPADIEMFKTEKNRIETAIKEEEERYTRWLAEIDTSLLTPEELAKAREENEDYVQELNNQLKELKDTYPYLEDIYGKNDASRLVIYIEDYAGNATVVGQKDFISTELLANSYNISVEGL